MLESRIIQIFIRFSLSKNPFVIIPAIMPLADVADHFFQLRVH